MKIGILTYHRSHNFGAMLQAYALKTYLNCICNCSISFIDYYPSYFHDNSLIDPATMKKLGLRGKIGYILLSICHIKSIYIRKGNFNNFFDKYISPLTPVSDNYDLAIYGSDQIWRYQNRDSFRGYSDVYWGQSEISSKRKITYAVSMGSIPKDNDSARYCNNAIRNFEAISVRESELKDYLKSICPSLKIFQHIDPIFLLNKRQWSKINGTINFKEKYILVYNLQNIKLIEECADKIKSMTNFPIIHLMSSYNKFMSKKGEIYHAGPDDFISLVRNAEYVVTSSFHGTAFSILFNVPFYCNLAVAPQRVYSLLESVGLENRIIDNVDNLVFQNIDWTSVNNKLEISVNNSKQYLKMELLNKGIND